MSTYIQICLYERCDASGLIRNRVDCVGSDVAKNSHVQTTIEGGSANIGQCTNPYISKVQLSRYNEAGNPQTVVVHCLVGSNDNGITLAYRCHGQHSWHEINYVI